MLSCPRIAPDGGPSIGVARGAGVKGEDDMRSMRSGQETFRGRARHANQH